MGCSRPAGRASEATEPCVSLQSYCDMAPSENFLPLDSVSSCSDCEQQHFELTTIRSEINLIPPRLQEQACSPAVGCGAIATRGTRAVGASAKEQRLQDCAEACGQMRPAWSHGCASALRCEVAPGSPPGTWNVVPIAPWGQLQLRLLLRVQGVKMGRFILDATSNTFPLV